MADVRFRQLAFRDGRLCAVEAYLYSHLADPAPLTLAQAAAIANMCPGHFSRTFSDCVGIGFRAWQRAVRMDVAMRLLVERRMPLRLVREAVGYRDASTFGRAFKRCHGLTPRALRQFIGVHPELTNFVARCAQLDDVVKRAGSVRRNDTRQT